MRLSSMEDDMYFHHGGVILTHYWSPYYNTEMIIYQIVLTDGNHITNTQQMAIENNIFSIVESSVNNSIWKCGFYLSTLPEKKHGFNHLYREKIVKITLAFRSYVKCYRRLIWNNTIINYSQSKLIFQDKLIKVISVFHFSNILV